MRTIRRPSKARTVPQFPTPEDCERLLACVDADATLNASRLKSGEVVWMSDVIRIAVGTGMRLFETCHMRWSWIDTRSWFLTVKNGPTFKTKNGHERSIYVTGEAREVLLHLQSERTTDADNFIFLSRRGQKGDARQLNGTYVSKRFLHYVRMAKLSEGVHFHTLRHMFASWLVMAGVDLFRVRELLGHADISTTMRYAHLAPKSFKYDLERVFGGDSTNHAKELHMAYAA